MTYRVGNHQPQNIYRDDQYIGVMFDPETAAEIVAAMNERDRDDADEVARINAASRRRSLFTHPDDRRRDTP